MILSTTRSKRHPTGFYRYFDLCNQQLFLRHQLPPRFTAEVWNDWRDGIDAHLHRASFQRAWQIIGEGTFNRDPRISFFNGLRALRSETLSDDPAEWPPDWVDQLRRAGHEDT